MAWIRQDGMQMSVEVVMRELWVAASGLLYHMDLVHLLCLLPVMSQMRVVVIGMVLGNPVGDLRWTSDHVNVHNIRSPAL